MILESFVVAGLAKLGFIVTAVKVGKRKKRTKEVVKTKGHRVKRKRVSQI